MNNGKVTPKLSKKKPQEEKSTSGKKLIQAKLGFKILSQSSKPPQTSTDPNVSNTVNTASIVSTENSDIRKRKLSYSSDNENETAVRKILRTNSNENSSVIDISLSSDDSDHGSIMIKSPNSKQDIDKGKLNSKLVIKLPLSSKKKRKKQKKDDQKTSSSDCEKSFDMSEAENPKKKLKPTMHESESTELKNDEKSEIKNENDTSESTKSFDISEADNPKKNPTINVNESTELKNDEKSEIEEETNQNFYKSNVNEIPVKHPDEIVCPIDTNRIDENTIHAPNDIKVNEPEPQKINEAQIVEVEDEEEDEKIIAEVNDSSLNATGDDLNLSATKKVNKVAVKKSEKELQRQREKREEREAQKDQRRKEKEEKEAQKKRERDEKEELKRKEKEEKEKKRLEEIEQKNEEKRLKEDERRKKEEQKEEERKKREDEKRKKEIEKEEAENKKKKAAEAFTKFFVPQKSNVKLSADDDQISLDSCKSEYRAFRPFEVKPDMALAPIVRRSLPTGEIKNLENILDSHAEVSKNDLYLSTLKSSSYKPGSFTRTLPKDITDSDDILIIENEMQDAGQPINDTTKPSLKYRAKFFSFHENRRPPYYGTWRKKSSTITSRKPLSMDKTVFDYEIDSDDEWEEEEEAGESLNGSDDEKESEDEYEVDNDFFVPHGHLSDEELLNDDETDDMNTPQNQKAKLKILQQEFAQEMKKKTEKIKPKLYGIFWEDENGNQSESCPDVIWNLLNKRSMIFTEPFLLKNDICDETGSSPKQNEKKNFKKGFPEQYIKQLIELTHGNRNKKQFIINEFLAHISQRVEEQKTAIEYTKKSIQDKINEIAVWRAHSEENKKKFLCWIVNPEILKKNNLSDLSIVNNWSYILKPRSKKEIDKNPDSENDTKKIKNNTEATIKKFTVSSKDEINSLTDTTADNIPKPSHPIKKRVQLISTPLHQPISSETKKITFNSFLKDNESASEQINTITKAKNVENIEENIDESVIVIE